MSEDAKTVVSVLGLGTMGRHRQAFASRGIRVTASMRRQRRNDLHGRVATNLIQFARFGLCRPIKWPPRSGGSACTTA